MGMVKIGNLIDSTVKVHVTEDQELSFDRKGHETGGDIREVDERLLNPAEDKFCADLKRAVDAGLLKELGEGETTVAAAGADGIAGTADDPEAAAKAEAEAKAKAEAEAKAKAESEAKAKAEAEAKAKAEAEAAKNKGKDGDQK